MSGTRMEQNLGTIHLDSHLAKERANKEGSIRWMARLLTMTVSQGNRNKSKNKQMGPNQTYKLRHSKGNHKENKKISYLQIM